MKYLLTTGYSTDKIEYYIIDLFKLYLTVYPGDVPENENIGFNFILTDTKKDEAVNEIKSRINQLINKISNKFPSRPIKIEVKSIEILDNTRVKIIINVNEVTEEIETNMYEL